MSRGRPRSSTPSYRLHTPSGRGQAVWTDSAGVRHFRLLPGPHKSPGSLAAFGKLLLELHVAPKGAEVPPNKRGNLTLVEVLAAYLDHAERHYRDPDGKPTSELFTVKLVIKSLRELYGSEPVAEFGPLKLKAVRQSWVAAGLSRGEANRRTRVAKRIVKWGVAEELVPPAVFQAISAVTGLQKGRTVARETAPVGPVADRVVNATLPHLNRHVRGLVEFQRLTGCRPGEACALRRCDIDTAGEVWLYKPPRHKNAHRGQARVIAIGPKGRELLKQFPTDDPAEYVFSPAKAVAEVRAARSAARATPRYESHVRRNQKKRKKNPRRAAGARYTHNSYPHAVARAAKRAGVEPWHPNQLRHSYATKVRKLRGLEAVQVSLGHAKMDTSQIYAEKQIELAVAVAREVG